MLKPKKTFAAVLAVIMTVILASPAFCAAAPTENIPILRFRSNIEGLAYTAEDGNRYCLYDDGEYVSAIADAALPYAALGLATGNWDKWCDAAWEQMKPAYEHFKPDAQGSVPEESRAEQCKEVSAYVRKDKYNVKDAYVVFLDQRTSPMDMTEYINDVVERIKSETGHDKIHFVGQCMGASYMLAYLYKYQAEKNYSDIESVTLSTITSNGTPGEDALFSGTLRFDLESSYRVLSVYDMPDMIDNIAGGALLQVIYDTLDLLYNSNLSQKATLALAQKIYDGVKDGFIARLLKEYYGRCGGYVSLVTDHYEQYKDYVFPTAEDKALYGGQIAKFDDFRYNVQMRQADIIRDMQRCGVNVTCVAQYGYQYGFLGCGELGLETSDVVVPVSRATFGATAARFGDKLSDEYVREREAAGFGRYISPDREIDASTCLLPDATWFVKNLSHSFDGSEPYMDLITAVTRTPGANVEKLEAQGYSQFSYNDTDAYAIYPLTGEETNVRTPASLKTQSYFRSLIALFKSLFALIKALVVR